jgi:hypothetical protein
MNAFEMAIGIMVVSFGVPFVLAPLAKAISQRIASKTAAPDPRQAERLASIERNLDVIAVEVEKLAESQRFLTKLLAEREAAKGHLPPGA